MGRREWPLMNGNVHHDRMVMRYRGESGKLVPLPEPLRRDPVKLEAAFAEALDVTVVISISGGASSLWLWEAAKRGVIERPKRLALAFADTGEEHEWTYETLEYIKADAANEGVPFLYSARGQSLGDHLIAINRDGLTRADHPPLYIAKDGGGRGRAEHRCTREFKVAPMRRVVSEWLAAEELPKRVVKWIGFGADERGRAIKAEGKQDVQWERLDFPAVRLSKRRGEQRADIERWTGRPAPRFSMCTICPWKTPQRWLDTPDAQKPRVYEIDESIRDMSRVGLTDGDAYLCDRLIPVDQLIKKGDPQPMLPGFGDAGCDGGACFL